MTPETIENPGLAALVAEATAQGLGDQENAANPGAPSPVQSLEKDWIDAVKYGADLMIAMLPDLRADYTADKLENLGRALARCDEHYGWGGIAAIINHPAVALVFAAVPLAVPLIRIAKERKAKAQGVTPPVKEGSGDGDKRNIQTVQFE